LPLGQSAEGPRRPPARFGSWLEKRRCYGLTAKELEARLGELNPIERVGNLAKARVPALLIHGDEDRVVPLKKNSAEFAARYKAAGAEGLVRLIVAKGQGHNFWEGFVRCQELVDFVIARTKAGAEKRAGREGPHLGAGAAR
jgi:pimeloyl-ACP methyl ester carboxylesterase